MLGVQSVPRSTDTSAETTAPMADSSIHDLNFLLQYTPDASRPGLDPMNSAATVLEE